MFRTDKKSHDNQTRNEQATNPAPQASTPQKPASEETSAVSQTFIQTPSTTRAMTESETLARAIKDGSLNGFIGNGTALTGEAMFKGMLRVDGHLSGTIISEDGTLIVGNNGQVDANVEVAIATINGTVNGDIIASKRIEIGRAAKVTGNIQTAALVIEQGATFEGSCRMLQLKKKADDQIKEEQVAEPSVMDEADELAQQSIVPDVAN
jgi:cytoskeletal protein CcmA (bactofilin family)